MSLKEAHIRNFILHNQCHFNNGTRNVIFIEMNLYLTAHPNDAFSSSSFTMSCVSSGLLLFTIFCPLKVFINFVVIALKLPLPSIHIITPGALYEPPSHLQSPHWVSTFPISLFSFHNIDISASLSKLEIYFLKLFPVQMQALWCQCMFKIFLIIFLNMSMLIESSHSSL